MTFQHGISITEAAGSLPGLVTVATAVIGLVATGPNTGATAARFPANTAVLITDMDAAIEDAGVTGTLKGALQAIRDQVKAPVVVVRVTPPAQAGDLPAAVIGGVTNGVKTGMQALLAAQAQLGVQPRIVGAPGLETADVVAALAIVARKLRGMAYASAVGADATAAATFAGGFAQRELMLLYPDALSAPGVTTYAAARALGLRAKIDQEQGWHKTLSNVPVDGVVGLTKDVGFDIQDSSCEATVLNNANVTALVRYNGFRFWGSRTTSSDPNFAFESAVRTAQVLQDTIADGLAWAIDKPLVPSLVKDIVSRINGEFAKLRARGMILGAKAMFIADLNPAGDLQQGKVRIDFEFTPVPPLEHVALTQSISDTFFAGFADAVNG